MSVPAGKTEHGLDWRHLFRTFQVPLLIWFAAVFVLWLASAGAIVYSLDSWQSRGQFGELFGAANSLFSGLAFAGVVIALLLQNHGLQLQLQEISKAHDWNRRKAAHDLICETSLGKFGELRRKIENKVKIYDAQQTSATLAPPLSREAMLELDAALNFLENVCLSIKNNVVDEEIVYNALSDILVGYWRWAKPYIDECRRTMSDDFWREIDPYERQWRDRSEQSQRDAIASRRLPGLPRL